MPFLLSSRCVYTGSVRCAGSKCHSSLPSRCLYTGSVRWQRNHVPFLLPSCCVYTGRVSCAVASAIPAQRTLLMYTQRDGREEWHLLLRSARCLCIHSTMEGGMAHDFAASARCLCINSAMEGRNGTCAAHAACIYTARWKGGMAHAQRTLPMYTQRDGREE